MGPTCQEGRPGACPANAAWSADGQRIAFDRGGAIRIMDADGTDRDGFTVPGLFALARPAFDATGSSVAFQGVDREGKRDIYIRNLIDGTVRRLTFAGGAEPAWSSDGRIAFTRAGNIYVIKADGTGKRRVTGKGGVQADWSPDGQKLVFVRGGQRPPREPGRQGPEEADRQDRLRARVADRRPARVVPPQRCRATAPSTR